MNTQEPKSENVIVGSNKCRRGSEKTEKRWNPFRIIYISPIIICMLLVLTTIYRLELRVYDAEYWGHTSGSIDFLLLQEFLLPKKSWSNIDLQMRYLINNDVCSTFRNENAPSVLVMNLVKTAINNRQRRDAIRNSIPKTELDKLDVRRIFLLASPSLNLTEDWSLLEQLNQEQEEYQDLVVGDFIDTYRNLTYKSLMGLDWATKYCPQAKFVLQQDDDALVDFYQLSDLLTKVSSITHENTAITTNRGQHGAADQPSLSNWGYSKEDPIYRLMTSIQQKIGPNSKDKRFILGFYLNLRVVREPTAKYFVSVKEYPNKNYPEYGWGLGYLTTVETARSLVETSKEVPFLWIDDVHITGILREKAGIEFFKMGSLISLSTAQTKCCVRSSQVDLDIKKGEKGRSNKLMKHLNINKTGASLNAEHAENSKWCHFLIGQTEEDLSLPEKILKVSKFCHESKSCQRIENEADQKNFCGDNKKT